MMQIIVPIPSIDLCKNLVVTTISWTSKRLEDVRPNRCNDNRTHKRVDTLIDWPKASPLKMFVEINHETPSKHSRPSLSAT